MNKHTCTCIRTYTCTHICTHKHAYTFIHVIIKVGELITKSCFHKKGVWSYLAVKSKVSNLITKIFIRDNKMSYIIPKIIHSCHKQRLYKYSLVTSKVCDIISKNIPLWHRQIFQRFVICHMQSMWHHFIYYLFISQAEIFKNIHLSSAEFLILFQSPFIHIISKVSILIPNIINLS